MGLGRHIVTASLGASLLFGGVATGIATVTPRASAQDAVTTGSQAYVDVDFLNVRTRPGITGTIATTLPYATVVSILSGPVAADGYSWFQLALDGSKIGWSVNGFLMGVPDGTGTPTPIGDFAAGDVVSVTADALNVRQTPSTAAAIVSTLAFGQQVTLTGGGQVVGTITWYPIAGGWVSGEFLATTGATPPTTPPTTPSATGGFAYGDTVSVTTDLLNVRQLPTLSAAVLTAYGYGTQAMITGEARQADGITWYPVDNTGWVSGDYLTKVVGGGGTTPPTTPPATPGSGSPSIVTTDVLNVRSEPSLSASIVATLYNGAQVTVIGDGVQADGFNWVNLDGLGWVAGQYLGGIGRPDGPDGSVTGTATVIVDAANVRAQPTTLSRIVDVLGYGTEVTTYGQARDSDGTLWYPINVEYTQWVAASLLQ